MKKMLFAIVFLVVQSATAQIQQGLRSSNYSGINGIQLNPSSFQPSPLHWDLNLISGGFFFENEYAYIENSNFLKLATHNGPILFRSQSAESQDIADDPNALYYNFFDATNSISNSLNAFVSLPSLSFRVNNLSFGIFLNLRSSFAANKLDEDLDYFSLDRWQEGEMKSINPVQIAGMLWSEIGFNAGFKVNESRRSRLYGGVNIKYLMGYEGFYINSPNKSQVNEISDTLLVTGGPYEYGIASSSLGANNNKKVNGKGLGLDLGITYIKKSFDKRPYKWKLGLSINDIGYVHFDQNAQEHNFDPSNLYDVDRASLASAGNIQGLISIVSQQSLGDSIQSLSATDFHLYTPSMLSVQFDYALNDKWFIGGLLNRRLDFSKQMVDRENILATSLRYENRWLEIGVPVTLYDDRHLRMGFWTRLYFLTIGSDHIASLFINEPQFTGSDIYFAIKINPFSIGKRYNARGSGRKNPENCNF